MATFADFIYECENYEHSAEYSDILKESSELALMERYLDNQEFMACHPISESVSEGYFAEAADEDKIQQIMEAAEAKKNSIWTKAKNAVIRAWKVVVNFFKKLFRVYDKMTADSKEVAKKILSNEITLEKSDIDRIFSSDVLGDVEINSDAYNVTYGNYKLYCTVSKDKTVSIPKIMNNIKMGDSISSKEQLSRRLQLLLSIGILNNDIRVECTDANDKSVELLSIYKVLKTFSPDSRDIAAAKKMFDKCIDVRNKKGIKISYSEKLVKTVEELESFITNGYDSVYNSDLTDMSEITQLLNDITRCASDTIKLYNAFKDVKQKTLAACKLIAG